MQLLPQAHAPAAQQGQSQLAQVQTPLEQQEQPSAQHGQPAVAVTFVAQHALA